MFYVERGMMVDDQGFLIIVGFVVAWVPLMFILGRLIYGRW